MAGLPFFACESEISTFFKGLNVARVHLINQSNKPSGQAAVYFASSSEAVEAAENFHGRFLSSKPPRRLSVYADEVGAKIVREEYSPVEPTRDALKDYVHKKAVGGKWPANDKFGMISHKNRYRRYKPPGNPKPRHG